MPFVFELLILDEYTIQSILMNRKGHITKAICLTTHITPRRHTQTLSMFISANPQQGFLDLIDCSTRDILGDV